LATVGPAEHTSDPKFQPTYRFQLASLSATLAPVDTDEPALGLTGTVAGNYEPRQRLLSFDRLDLKTAGGELLGTGSLQFASAGPPGIFLALSLTRMPVGQVKQLWPWFSAPGTRNWVLDNLISGGVVDSNLQYRVEPGRLGNRAGQRPLPKGLWDRRGQGSRVTARGVAAQGVAGRRVRRRVGPIAVDDEDASASSKSAGPCKTRSVKNRVVAHLSSRSTWRARNSQRSVNASHCSFTALAHNSQRGGAALLIRTSAEIEQPHRVTPG